MANINVKLKNAAGDVLYPQTEWNNIQNKPSVFVAQNANASAGTITTEGSTTTASTNLYKIVVPHNGARSYIALEYDNGNYLVLQSDGTWAKKTYGDLTSSAGLNNITCSSHTHIIKGTFK